MLVLVELRGGNDGLNTVVPYRDEHILPPAATARCATSECPTTQRAALASILLRAALMPLWQARELAIVLGVGYANPNRSHFRSIEIWDTASNSAEVLQEGWIARLFAKQKPPATFRR